MQATTENLVYRSNPITSIEQKFIQFHLKNPHVYQALEQLAINAHKAGVKKLGIGALVETLRYSASLQTKGDAYRLNNNFRALYARMLLRNHPELRGLIDLRLRRGALEGQVNQKLDAPHHNDSPYRD